MKKEVIRERRIKRRNSERDIIGDPLRFLKGTYISRISSKDQFVSCLSESMTGRVKSRLILRLDDYYVCYNEGFTRFPILE